jgi:phage regulator Rha-like protein
MTSQQVVQQVSLSLTITTKDARIDSRLLARYLENQHKSLFELIGNHRSDFEEFGLLRFQTEVIDGRGQPEKFVMLNEDQCILALSYSRNTERVRQLKVLLVKAFGEYRRTVAMYQQEYLPSFNALQDAIHIKAAESANEKMVHMNVAKAVNATVGIEPGTRSTASAQTQAWLTFAQDVAARAMLRGNDHHDGFQYVKRALQAVKDCIALECLDNHDQVAKKIGKEVAHAHSHL